MAKFGTYGKFAAQPGQRDALLEILLEAARRMEDVEGCESYIVGTPEDDADAVCVTELWSSEAAHDASLEIPGTRELIAQAMPMIAAPPEGMRFTALGGKGSSVSG